MIIINQFNKIKIIYFMFLLIFSLSLSSCSNNIEDDQIMFKYNESDKHLISDDFSSIVNFKPIDKAEYVYQLTQKENFDYYTLTIQDLDYLIGPSILEKNFKNISVWQYRGADCVLNVSWRRSNFNIKKFLAYDNNYKPVKYKTCLVKIIEELRSDPNR